MARHKLENELIAIEVEEHGAELKSLICKKYRKRVHVESRSKILGAYFSGTVSICRGSKRKTVSHQGTDLHDGAAWICP